LRVDQRDLKERRKFVYKYNVLDLVNPSASGNIGKNRILLVLKYKENLNKKSNNLSLYLINLDFITDFSSDSSIITEEKLKAFLEKLTK
jgi:hypothetical protein